MKRAAAVSVVVLTLLVPAMRAQADHDAVVHWAGVGERVIVVENNLPDTWLAPLKAAAADWSRSPYIEIVIASAGTCWDLATPLEFCWSHYSPAASWIGLSSTWTDGSGHLTHVVMEANADKTWGSGKRRFVACHELGHALGLGHRPEINGQSCMMPRFGFVTLFPARPDAHDMAAVLALYGHDDTVGPSPSSGSATRVPGAFGEHPAGLVARG